MRGRYLLLLSTFLCYFGRLPQATPGSLRVKPGPVACEASTLPPSCPAPLSPPPFHLGLGLSGASRPRECQTQDRLWWATGSEAPGGGFEGRDFGGSERLAGLGDVVSSTRGPGMERHREDGDNVGGVARDTRMSGGVVWWTWAEPGAWSDEPDNLWAWSEVLGGSVGVARGPEAALSSNGGRGRS